MLKSVCVFCGSSVGTRPSYRNAADTVASAFVARGIRLVYGGGNVGLMGALADGMLARGGEVIGVIPRQLVTRELAHQSLTRLHVVESMHERKALMADLADGFVALPGGYGTFEEFCEAVTWSQLGLHQKPCGLLNVDGYYDGLLGLFDHAVTQGFIRPEYRRLVIVEEQPTALLDRFEQWQPPDVRKWIGPDGR